MTLPPNKACEMADEREKLAAELLDLCIDWDDTPMHDDAEPRSFPPCGLLRRVAAALRTPAPPVTREAEKGPAFLLKLANGDDVPSYRTVAGMRLYGPADAHQIDGRGIFLGSAAEGEIRGLALSGEAFDFELSFEDGTKHRERYVVALLEPLGVLNGEQNYRVLLRALKFEPVVDQEEGPFSLQNQAESAKEGGPE